MFVWFSLSHCVVGCLRRRFSYLRQLVGNDQTEPIYHITPIQPIHDICVYDTFVLVCVCPPPGVVCVWCVSELSFRRIGFSDPLLLNPTRKRYPTRTQSTSETETDTDGLRKSIRERGGAIRYTEIGRVPHSAQFNHRKPNRFGKYTSCLKKYHTSPTLCTHTYLDLPFYHSSHFTSSSFPF